MAIKKRRQQKKRFGIPDYARVSLVRGQIVMEGTVDADGTETRVAAPFTDGTSIPIHKPTIKPTTWPEMMLERARNHKIPENRKAARQILEDHCEQLIADYVRRRRIHDVGGRIKLIAIRMVDEKIHPGVTYSPTQMAAIIGINPKTYHRVRLNGCCWKKDIEHIRDRWFDCFRKNIPL